MDDLSLIELVESAIQGQSYFKAELVEEFINTCNPLTICTLMQIVKNDERIRDFLAEDNESIWITVLLSTILGIKESNKVCFKQYSTEEIIILAYACFLTNNVYFNVAEVWQLIKENIDVKNEISQHLLLKLSDVYFDNQVFRLLCEVTRASDYLRISIVNKLVLSLIKFEDICSAEELLDFFDILEQYESELSCVKKSIGQLLYKASQVSEYQQKARQLLELYKVEEYMNKAKNTKKALLQISENTSRSQSEIFETPYKLSLEPQEEIDEYIKQLIIDVDEIGNLKDEQEYVEFERILLEIDGSLPYFEYVNQFAAESRLPIMLIEYVIEHSNRNNNSTKYHDDAIIACCNVLYRLVKFKGVASKLVTTQKTKGFWSIIAESLAFYINDIEHSAVSMNTELSIMAIERITQIVYKTIEYCGQHVLQNIHESEIFEVYLELLSDFGIYDRIMDQLIEICSILCRIATYEYELATQPYCEQNGEAFELLYNNILLLYKFNINSQIIQESAALLLQIMCIQLNQHEGNQYLFEQLIIQHGNQSILTTIFEHILEQEQLGVTVVDTDFMYSEISLLGLVFYIAQEKVLFDKKFYAEIVTLCTHQGLLEKILSFMQNGEFPLNNQISFYLLFLTTLYKYENTNELLWFNKQVCCQVIQILISFFNYHLSVYNVVFCFRQILHQMQQSKELTTLLSLLLGLGFHGSVGRQYGKFISVTNEEIFYHSMINIKSITSIACSEKYSSNQEEDIMLTRLALLYYINSEEITDSTRYHLVYNLPLDYSYYTLNDNVLKIVNGEYDGIQYDICKCLSHNIRLPGFEVCSFILLISLFSIAYSQKNTNKDKLIKSLELFITAKNYEYYIKKIPVVELKEAKYAYFSQFNEFVTAVIRPNLFSLYNFLMCLE